ncbi:MAG TPA: hypothetical protein VIU62_04020 [Chloroflexota bacterium]|jgi:hypothetical protein
MLQPPAIIVGVAIASIYALAFALVIGKTGNRLWWYWAFSTTGFFAGDFLASRGHLADVYLGQLPLVESSLASAAMLTIAALLRR